MDFRKLITTDVVTIAPEATVLAAARLMRSKHVGALVVVDDDHRPLGILTDRDIVVGVLARDIERLASVTVKEACSPDPIVARADEDSATALERMKRHGFRRLPVVDARGILVGVFALDDALGLIAGELASVVGVIRAEHLREEKSRGAP